MGACIFEEISAQACTVRKDLFRKNPFDLNWGSYLEIHVQALNQKGSSKGFGKSEPYRLTSVPDLIESSKITVQNPKIENATD